jgi:N-acetylglucosaminyldiphosphoundecaprenol N-acetyl-beta-D-mannosaminyltransferase
LTLGVVGGSGATPLTAHAEVGGVKLDRRTEADVVQHIIMRSLDGEGGWVVTPNIDICRQIGRDEQVRVLVEGATLVVADGMPLVWASRLRGQPLQERVAGSALIFSLSAAAALSGRSIYLLGGDPGVPEAAAHRLSTMYPGLRIAGTDSPPFGFERNESRVAAIRDRVCQAAPDIVYVGLGFPKQERLIAILAPALPTAWFIGCGSAIGFAGGQMRRAPAWMRRSGLEWVHRLMNEPQRLSRRYLIQDLPYAARLLAAACMTRLIRQVRSSAINDADVD